MEEVKRSKSNISNYVNYEGLARENRTNPYKKSQLNTGVSSAALSTSPSELGLNNTLGQSMITNTIGNQANELLKIQQSQSRFASVSPHRADAASYQQGKSNRPRKANYLFQYSACVQDSKSLRQASQVGPNGQQNLWDLRAEKNEGSSQGRVHRKETRRCTKKTGRIPDFLENTDNGEVTKVGESQINLQREL